MLPSPTTTYSMHIQCVHTQVEGCEVHGLEHLHERLSLASLHMDDLPWILLHGPLDEPQQVFLVHTGCGVDMGIHLGLQGITDIEDGLGHFIKMQPEDGRGYLQGIFLPALRRVVTFKVSSFLI